MHRITIGLPDECEVNEPSIRLVCPEVHRIPEAFLPMDFTEYTDKHPDPAGRIRSLFPALSYWKSSVVTQQGTIRILDNATSLGNANDWSSRADRREPAAHPFECSPYYTLHGAE
jgi:hypothetical protein